MEHVNTKKKENIESDLELLRQNMVKYFKCNEEDIKISEAKFDTNHFTATIAYNYIDWNRSSLRDFIYSICQFDIEGDYELKKAFRYEGHLYRFDNLSHFFEIISKEMAEPNNK